MAEIDTSSYKLPVQPSALDTLGKLQGLKQGEQAIQSNAISIDKAKLELAYKGMEYLTGEINSLPPTASPQDVFKVMQNAVNMKFLTPDAFAQAIKEVPNSPQEMQAYKDRFIARAQHAREALEYYVGATGMYSNGQTDQPIRTSPRPGMGIRADGAPIQKQTGPGATVQDTNETLPNGQPNPNYGQPRLLGPQAPQLAPGTTDRPGGLPIAPLQTGPIRNPALQGQSSNFGGNVLGGVVDPPTPAQSVTDRFPNIPRGPATGLPPGVGEAATATGLASGRQLAEARERSANYQSDIFPLAKAIPALEKLGPKGTGPGTEAINNLKSFVLSNVPGVKESDFSGTVKDFDVAKKYLTDFVSRVSSGGTNDRLAAAFAANPSVGISNAAAVDVAKSALALRRMQQAQVLEFEKSGKKDHEFSKWVSQRTNDLDPRAFGVDLMSPEAKSKLRIQLERNPKELAKFERSYKVFKEHINE